MIYAWGANNFGQLGIGSFAGTAVPTRITDMPAVAVRQLDASKYNTAVLSREGEVYIFGKSVG